MAFAFSPEQIDAFERHVGLPYKYRRSNSPPLDINYLTALHVHQIAAVPYENLNLHYSTHYSVSLDPQVQFQKIVTDARGRGGYCMEGNLFFNNILKAVGFQVIMTGVRIRPRVAGVPHGDYTGWVHVTNIITLSTGERYSCDVSFGGDGPTKPLPLISGHISRNLGTQEVRLIKDKLPHEETKEKNFWVYQYRNSVEKEWNSFYGFPELEFFRQDFEIINWFTSTHIGSVNFQTSVVLVVKFLLGKVEGQDEEGIVGKIMLVGGDVKRNDGGRTVVVSVCKNEGERVRALKQYFGISLTEEESRGIIGRNVELLGQVVES